MLSGKRLTGQQSSSGKRSLSHSEIVQCERAAKPHCDCRCGGALHGANRAPSGAGRDFFESLPLEDPHHLQTRAEKRGAAKSRRQQRRQEKFERERADFLVEKARRRAEREAAWAREGVAA